MIDLTIILIATLSVPLVVGAWHLPGYLLRRRMNQRIRSLRP